MAALLALSPLTFAWQGMAYWTIELIDADGVPYLEQDLDYYTHCCDYEPCTRIDSIIGNRQAPVVYPDTDGKHICWMTATFLNGVRSARSEPMEYEDAPPDDAPFMIIADSKGSGCSG